MKAPIEGPLMASFVARLDAICGVYRLKPVTANGPIGGYPELARTGSPSAYKYWPGLAANPFGSDKPSSGKWLPDAKRLFVDDDEARSSGRITLLREKNSSGSPLFR